jgi:hypothetical protein
MKASGRASKLGQHLELISVLEFLEINFRVCTERKYWWDGKKLNIYREDSVSNICHEIAHWLLATPRQRKLPEYGCGTDPDTNSDADEFKINTTFMPIEKRRHLNDDAYASLLGMAIENYLGFDFKATAEFHSWEEDVFYIPVSESYIPFFFVVHKLNEWGLLNGHIPVALEKYHGHETKSR